MSSDQSQPKPEHVQLTGVRFAPPITLPGSPEAVAAGCICSPERNDRARDLSQSNDHLMVVIKEGCPLHEIFPGPIDPEFE